MNGLPEVLVESRIVLAALEDARIAAKDLLFRVSRDGFECRIDVLDGPGRIGDDDHFGGLLDCRRKKLPRRLRPLALRDDVEYRDKVFLLRAVDRDGKPHLQGFDMGFETLGHPGQRHPAIGLQQRGIGLLDARE